MKNYYALCCWGSRYNSAKALFKLNKNPIIELKIKKIEKLLLTDNDSEINIFPFIDSVLIANKKIIYSIDGWFWADDGQIQPPYDQKHESLFLSKRCGDKILEFDSDDDARLWFELST